MQNKIDYHTHKIYTPPFYHRQYENDLPQDKESTSYTEVAKRTAHIALPFLSLYSPFGRALSLTMGSVRVMTSGAGVVTADNLHTCANRVMQVGLAVLALVGTLYNFTLGLYLTTGADLICNFVRILERLHELEYKKAGEELLQALASGLYLAIIVTGSLEVILASIIIQAIVSFVQAKEEWKEGRIPEAMAKTLMGMIRLYQANGQMGLIQRRNNLFNQYKELIGRIKKGREIDHLYDHPAIARAQRASEDRDAPVRILPILDDEMRILPMPDDEVRILPIPDDEMHILPMPDDEVRILPFPDQRDVVPLPIPKDHPLADLPKKIQENRAILKDADDVEYDFGSHFYGYGKQHVKGMNVTFREEDGQPSLDFKLNHVFRDRLEGLIDQLQNTSPEDLNDLLKAYGSNIEAAWIGKKPLSDNNFWIQDDMYEIHLKGLGKIFVGASPDFIGRYDRVTVEMEKGKNLYDFHEALSFLNLDDALRQSAQEDVDRMKIGHLFRMFAPREATHFERTDAFFELPLDQLKAEILKRSPEMGGVFEQWFSKMELRETLPGRMRWAVDGISDELKKNGARGLTAAVTGAWMGGEELYERVASMLKMGMISHEMRDNSDFGRNGLSGGFDYWTGGSDSVFTQMVTKTNKSFQDFMYWSPVRFLISPKILESGTYQYHSDNYGSRKYDPNDDDDFFWWEDEYIDRNNIFDFATVERLYPHMENEVMIKDRIPPEFFTGIVVDNETTKQALLDYLRGKNLIQKDASGRETILSQLVDDFFHVGHEITDEQFA